MAIRTGRDREVIRHETVLALSLDARRSALPWLLCAASLVEATWHVATHPEWNLDVVFYAALMHPDTASNGELHMQVYAELSRALPPELNESLARGSQYRRQVSESPSVFTLQLPFYRSKPLYVWLGRALTWTGVPSVFAPRVLSVASFFALGIIIPLFAWSAGAYALAPWLGALAVWLPSLRELGALATPDALATALLACAAASSLARLRLASLLLCAAVLARPDLAFIALGVLAAAWLAKPEQKRDIAMAAMLVALVAAAILPLTGGYGWQIVTRHTFLSRLVSEEDLLKGLSVRAYFKSLGRGVHGYMTSRPAGFLPYLCFAALAWLRSDSHGVHRHAGILLAAIWFSTALRFLALPLLADRMFAPAYVCTLALASALLTTWGRQPSGYSSESSRTIAR